AASTPASADAMFTALGLGRRLADPRFATNDARIANGEAVDQAIAEAIGQRSREEIVRLFETEGLTAPPVYDIADIMEDPHFKARHTFVDLPDPELGTATMSAPRHASPTRRAPSAGSARPWAPTTARSTRASSASPTPRSSD